MTEFSAPDPRALAKENAEMPYSADREPTHDGGLGNDERRRLMAIDGVLGVGIGQNRIGNTAVVVYVRDQGVANKLPKEIGGLSVEVEVTGTIDALKVK